MWDFYPDFVQAFQPLEDFYPEGFRLNLANFFPDSAGAFEKFLAKFYPDFARGVKGIIGDPWWPLWDDFSQLWAPVITFAG